MVSTPLKNISHNENLPQVGVKIQNVWNHHLEKHFTIKRPAHLSELVRCDTLALAKESSSPNKRSSVGVFRGRLLFNSKNKGPWWVKPWPFWDGEFTWPLKKGWKVSNPTFGDQKVTAWITWQWMRRSCSLGEICWFDFCVFFLWNQKCSSKDCVNKFYML